MAEPERSDRTETRQPYDPKAKCPKCDSPRASTAWQPGTVRISRARGFTLIRADGPAEPGWMHRMCENCGYDWAESPLS